MSLCGKPAKLQITTIGPEPTVVDSEQYSIFIMDEKGCKVFVDVYGIESISTPIKGFDAEKVAEIFPYMDGTRAKHPVEGDIDILIGYQYAAYHPHRIDNFEHLILLESRFGYTVAGSHSIFKGYSRNIVKHATVLHIAAELDTLHSIENLGVNCNPKCGSCKCGTCHLGGKDMTIEEQKDLELIDSKLQFQPNTGRFIIGYPWTSDPMGLPRNEDYAYSMLLSTEKRLMKDDKYASIYREQMNDLLNRAARRVTKEELEHWNGPKFFIAHHAVLKPDSKSTPLRIVFNSSRKHNGSSLNDFYAKGPTFFNNMLGIILRFRENRIGFVGDIHKMFHSIDISYQDQMTHLFLWRDLDQSREVEVYAMTKLNMGDKPSAAIAQAALRKTAEMAPEQLNKAAEIILRNSHMDDICGSTDSIEEAERLTEDISTALKMGGFKIKGKWLMSGQQNEISNSTTQKTVQLMLNMEDPATKTEKVLGMQWDPVTDELSYMVKLQTITPNKHTKRTVLSKANSIFDPLGLLAPFTVRIKILLRKVWAHEPKVNWDDELPSSIKQLWHNILDEIKEIQNLRFKRSTKPENAVDSTPILVVFSDGSKQAYGAVAYARWRTKDGYTSRLIAAKSRIAPLKVEDIVRLELSGATISSRLRAFICKELKMNFQKTYHIVDSSIVKGMINKASYGFNTFAGNRIGEIHRQTETEEWFWIEGNDNVADIITRGCSPEELGEESVWQNGPPFMSLPEEQWPISTDVEGIVIPELRKNAFTATVVETNLDTLSKRIDITRFSKFMLLIYTTARILKLYRRFVTGGSKKDTEIKPYDLKQAENFWIKEAQRDMESDIKKGRYKKLQPKLNSDGIFVVGGRTERWMGATWNRQYFILLPKHHRLSYLIALYEHKKIGHLAHLATISKIRSKYWIVGITRIVNKIINTCVPCKMKFKKFEKQIMSPLPIERIRISPAFYNVGIDYFGPYAVRGEVQKRTRGKVYGVIFTCLASRAVHVDIANDYSTDGFLATYDRYTSIRGYPHKIYSDKGSNLSGASNELKSIVEDLNWTEIQAFGHKNGTEWDFSPGDSPWYNGAVEALVKSVKRALLSIIDSDTIMSPLELQTAMYQAAQLVNQRPIGRHPKKPEEGTYLTPNDLLLGRSSPDIPQGPYKERNSNKYRHDQIQKIVAAFWERWMREVFPSLVIQPKWHTEHRNVQTGDVVVIEDSNTFRGVWKMGVVDEAIISKDGKVRRCKIMYKTPAGTVEVIERAIQKLIVIAPVGGEDK